MKETQIMNSLKKIGKIVLLYGTILYFFCFISIAESLASYSICYPIFGLFILIVLIGANTLTLENENLEDFVPKFLK